MRLPRGIRRLISSLCLALIAYPAPVLSEFIEDPIVPYVMRLGKPDTADPILFGGHSLIYGSTVNFPGGSIYFSCYPNRLDQFRLNLVLDTQIPDFFVSYSTRFVGVKYREKGAGQVVASRPTETISEIPPEFNIRVYSPASLQVVTPFDEYGVYDNRMLYVSSFPDASFWEEMKKSNRLMLIIYDEKDRRFHSVFDWNFELNDATARAFLAACLEE